MVSGFDVACGIRGEDKFQHKYKKKKKNIHKIHLHATSNINLIFHSQDIIWKLTILYILSSKSDITLARIVVKSKNRHYRT